MGSRLLGGGKRAYTEAGPSPSESPLGEEPNHQRDEQDESNHAGENSDQRQDLQHHHNRKDTTVGALNLGMPMLRLGKESGATYVRDCNPPI